MYKINFTENQKKGLSYEEIFKNFLSQFTKTKKMKVNILKIQKFL